jgi:4-hydroxy-tetrahydrodipicolinate reductase
MKIGLFGFGKTGKAVAQTILQNNEFSLEWVIRRKHTLENRNISEYLGIESNDEGMIYSIESTDMNELCENHPVDYIIDFSSENGIYEYGEAARKNKIKIISAISHYDEKEIRLLKKTSQETTVFWSPNITLGVNFLIYAAKFLQKIAPWSDIEIIEEHFKGKKGVSGTAKKIAKNLQLKEENINSIRAGGIVGKHEVIFGFPFQTVRLIHESISREAFGNGVLFVAENIKKFHKGFINFEDILKPYFVEDI